MDIQSILEQAGGSKNGPTETCRPLRPRQQIGIETIGRRAIGIPSILNGLKICEKKKNTELGPVSVVWRKTSRQPTGGVNSTPTNTARTDAHSVSAHALHRMITFHHANTRGSRAGRPRIARNGVLKRFRHPRVMSRSLPHLTLTTSTSSLSPTSPIFPTFSPSQSCPLVHDP